MTRPLNDSLRVDPALLDQLSDKVRVLGQANSFTLITAMVAMADGDNVKSNASKVAALDQMLARLVADIDDDMIPTVANHAATCTVRLAFLTRALEQRLSTPGAARPARKKTAPSDIDTLLRVIDEAPLATLKTMSVRTDLDETCTEKLIDTGYQDIWRSVTRNLLAPLNASSQQKLLAEARDDEALRIALLRRPHLIPDIAADLMTLMGKRGRPDKGIGAALAKLPSGEQAEINRLLELSHRNASNTHEPLTREEIAQMQEAGRISLDETIILYVTAGHPLAANALIAQRLGVNADEIASLIKDGDEFAFAAICRRLSLNPATFATLLRFKDKRHRIEPRSLNKLAASFFEHDPRKLAIFIRQFSPAMGEDVLPAASASPRRTIRRKNARPAHVR